MLAFRGTYREDWPALAARVKADAAGRCVRCAHPHDPAAGHCLTVHHFDGDRSNNARWNLMGLCQRCHLSIQGRVDPSNPLLFEPAAWAIPYLVGYYAAGRGIPGPLYDPARWRERYEQEIGPWPAWAEEWTP